MSLCWQKQGLKQVCWLPPQQVKALGPIVQSIVLATHKHKKVGFVEGPQTKN